MIILVNHIQQRNIVIKMLGHCHCYLSIVTHIQQRFVENQLLSFSMNISVFYHTFEKKDH